MSATREQAERCAASAPVGMFGIDDLLMVISVIELGFKLWQACSGASTASEVASAADIASRVSLNRRKARRKVWKAARRHGLNLDDDQLDAMTKHMLDHISQTPAATVAACCAEPRIEDSDDE